MKIYCRILENLEISEGFDIIRRYFVMNGFDGALTALGIIFGSFLVAVHEPISLIMTGMGASIAMGISGFWIAYLTETAERERDLQELEDQMIKDLRGTEVAEAHFLTSLIISLVDGLSPFLFSLISIIPFFLVLLGFFGMNTGYLIAFVLIVIEVLVLGFFLGAVSNQNKIMYALKTLTALIAVVILTFLLGVVEGL
ncbi:MAG: hypothetical protein ACFFC7_11985 [Candidatus Hermodarchaeota archaeon]